VAARHKGLPVKTERNKKTNSVADTFSLPGMRPDSGLKGEIVGRSEAIVDNDCVII
jgi:hypothetical protein